MKIVFRSLLIVALLVLLFATYSFYVWKKPYITENQTVFIEPGTGGRAIVALLNGAGLVPDPWKILFPIAASGNAKHLKAGEYALTAGMSPEQVFAFVAAGKVVTHSLTVPEGFNVAQLRTALAKETMLTGDLPASIEEGSVFPDTVYFIRGDSRASVVERLQQEMQTVLEQAWEKRDESVPLRSPEEALTLASIVELETGVKEERAHVAAVYENRLRLGMKLQADPTVAYGIAPEGMTRELTLNDLKRNSPYNTYVHEGLPPTPICNPGKASIEAVLHPSPSDDIYFVATGNGGHYFSKSEKEHMANVAKYRAALKAQQQQAK